MLISTNERKVVHPNWATLASGVIPEGMSLISDIRPFNIIKRDTITESVGGKKKNILRCSGVFQRADEKNENGRIYPFEVLKEAVENMQEAIEARRVMGEFDHPPDAKIHLDRVSHLVTRLWMEGKTVLGEIMIINDSRCPCGGQLACLLDYGIQVGISSRGVGDMEITMSEGGDEAYEVQPGFAFVTFDSVAEPSVSGTQLMMMESRNRLKNIPDRRGIERQLIKEFHNHLSS